MVLSAIAAEQEVRRTAPGKTDLEWAVALAGRFPKADDYAADYADKLREALPQITELAGSGAGHVRSAFTGAQGADPGGGEAAHVRDRLVTKVPALAGAKQFSEARDLLHGVDDQGVSGQVRTLVDYAEAAGALERRGPRWAFTLSNTIRGGVKRALLYAGTAAATQDRDEALPYFQLGVRDTELLSAEQRMVTTAALSSVMLPKDAESGFLALSLLVKAMTRTPVRTGSDSSLRWFARSTRPTRVLLPTAL